MEYKIGDTVFHDWVITRKIGEGATGRVYEIEKKDFGTEIKAALKVICIAKADSEMDATVTEGMNEAETEEFFYGFVEEILQEIKTMVSLRGHLNIVSYEDHCVIPHEGRMGWDILIKIELLTPLSVWTKTHQMNEKEVIRLGYEISSALSYTAEHGLMHRDVKPANIFVDKFDRFKLGDFGISRTVEKTAVTLSQKGTRIYMAPEVFYGEKYNAQVDIYSLGIVLYQFLNENRLPFYPPASEKITVKDVDEALVKRMRGDALPEPLHGREELKQMVLKACAYRPRDRYASAEEMRCDFQRLLEQKEETPKKANRAVPMILGCILVLAVGSLVVKTGKEQIPDKKIELLTTETEPETVREQSSETATDGTWYYISSTYKDGIAVRSEPTGESEQLTRLPHGTEFYVEKYHENWGYTTVDGVSGWVALDYASLLEDAEAPAWYYIRSTYKDGIAVRSEPTGESEQLTRLSYGTEFYVEKSDRNWGYTTVNGVSGWIALDYASLLENDQAEVWYRITSTYKKGIAVRSEPTGESEQLTRLPYGTEFYVEKTEKNWGYTTVNGVSGWIALDYAEVIENTGTAVGEKTEDDQTVFYQQKKTLTDIQIGDEIRFGVYEQDNNLSNGKEEIEWKVLDKQENKILVISKKALCCHNYLSEYTATDWEHSEIRKWLNEEFLQNAFSEYHQHIILDTQVSADANPDYTSSSGEDTTDKIYLLSLVEAKRYFNSPEARKCQPTIYTEQQGAYVEEENVWWWLRTMGKDEVHAALVYTDGEIRSEGYRVYVNDGTVRPVMWLDLSSISA